MKKRIRFCAFLIGLIFISGLCACSGGGTSSTSDDEKKTMSTEWDGFGSLATLADYNLRIRVDGSAVSGLQNNLIDYTANNSSVWFSGVGNGSAGEHYAVLDLGGVYNVHKIGITPYLFTEITENGEEKQLDEVSCFPKDLAISYCVDDGKYTTAYSLNDYTPVCTVNTNVYGAKYASDLEFGFGGGYVTARFVKVTFSDMTDDKLGNYLVKICSLKAYVSEASEIDEAKRVYEESLMPVKYNGFSVTASSVNDADPLAPFKISALSDGDYGTLWCAEWVNELSPETDEYIDIMTDGTVVAFKKIVIIANKGNESMPADFDFQYQIDDGGFVTAYSYVDYVNPKGATDNFNVFNFEKPIYADTIRIQFKKKTPNSSGYYVVLLAEVTANADLATKEEIALATTEYHAALGQSAAGVQIADDKSFLIWLIICSASSVIIGIVLFILPVRKKKEEKR